MPNPPDAVRLTPEERQFASALRLLRAALDNMDLSFDGLLRSRSATEAPKSDAAPAVTERATVGGRRVFGGANTPAAAIFQERALRATEAGENLQALDDSSTVTDSDAVSSSEAQDKPLTEAHSNGNN